MENKPVSIGKISFGFSKIKKKPDIIPQSKPVETKQNIEYITTFDNKEIEPKVEEKPIYTIPVSNVDGIKDRIMASRNKSDSKKEESEIKPIAYEKPYGARSGNVIPLPRNDFEEEDEPADYDSVPVTEFGFAMLRGMGWAPGKGIGKKQKVAEYRELELRPQGLGLGAGPDSIKRKEESEKK